MSTLPHPQSESKPKTIAEIAQAANSKPPHKTGDPTKPQQKSKPAGRLNDGWNHQLEKFIGKNVEVKTNDEQILTGVCIALPLQGASLILKTATNTVIIRNWTQIWRASGEPVA